MDSSIVCNSKDRDEHNGLGEGEDDNYGLSQVCDLFGGTCETWSSRKSSPKSRFSEPCKIVGVELSKEVSAVGSPRPNSKRKAKQNRARTCDKSEGSKPSVIESSASDSSTVGGCEVAGCNANGFGAVFMTSGRSAEAKRFQEEQQRKQEIRELYHTNKALLGRIQQLQEEATRQRAVDDEPSIKEQLSTGSSESHKTARSLLDNDESIADRDGSSPLLSEQSKLQAVETLNRDLEGELCALKKVVEGQRNVKQDLNNLRERYTSIKIRNKEVETELVGLQNSIRTCTEENDFLSKKLSYLEKRRVGEVDLPNLINRDTATRAIILDLNHEIHNLKCEVAVERILKQRFKGELQRSRGDELDEGELRSLFQSEDIIRCEILGEQRKLRQEHSFIANKFQKNIETVAEHYWKEEHLLRYEIDSLHTFMHENGMEPFSITESLYDEGRFQASLENAKGRKFSVCSRLETEGLLNDKNATGEAGLLANSFSQIIRQSDSRGIFPDDESDAEDDFGPIAPANGKMNVKGAGPTDGRIRRTLGSSGLIESEEMKAIDGTVISDCAQFSRNDIQLGSFPAALAGIAVMGAAFSARQVDQDGLADGSDVPSMASLDRSSRTASFGQEANPCTTGQPSSCTPQTSCSKSDKKSIQQTPEPPVNDNAEIVVAESSATSEESKSSCAANSSHTRAVSTIEIELPIAPRLSSELMSTIDLQSTQAPHRLQGPNSFLDGQQRGESQCTVNIGESTSPSSAAVLSDLLEAEAAQVLREDQASQPRNMSHDERSLPEPTNNAPATGLVPPNRSITPNAPATIGIPVETGTILPVVEEDDATGEQERRSAQVQRDCTLLRVEAPLESDHVMPPRELLGEEEDAIPIEKRVDFLSSGEEDDVRGRSSVTLDDSTTSSDESMSDGSDEETTSALAKTFNLLTEPQKWGKSVDNSPVLLAFENYVCSGIDTADSQILSQSGISETQGSVTSGSILSDGQPLNPMDLHASCTVASLENKDHPSDMLPPVEPHIDRDSYTGPLLDNEEHAKTVIDAAVNHSEVLNKSDHSTATNETSNLEILMCEPMEQPINVLATAEVSAEVSTRSMLNLNEESNVDQQAPKEMSISERIAMFEKTIRGNGSTTVLTNRLKSPANGTDHDYQQAKHSKAVDVASMVSPVCTESVPLRSTVALSLGLVDEDGRECQASKDEGTMENTEHIFPPPEAEESQCNAVIELVAVAAPKPPTIESEVRAMAEDFFVLKGDASSDQGSHLSMLPRREICVDGETEKSTDPVSGELLSLKDPLFDCVPPHPDVANEESIKTNAPQAIAGDNTSEDSGIIACSSSETTSEVPYCGEVAEEEPPDEANMADGIIEATLDVAADNGDSSLQMKPEETSEVVLPLAPVSELQEVQSSPPLSSTCEQPKKEAVVKLVRISNGDGVRLVVPSLTPSFDSSKRSKSLGLEPEQAKDRDSKLPTVDDSDKEDCDASSWSTISVSRELHGLGKEDMLNGRAFGMKSRKKHHSEADLVALHQWGMIPGSGRTSPQNEEMAATSADGPEGEALYEHEDYNETMIIRTMPNSDSFKSEKTPQYDNLSALATKEDPQIQDDVSELSQSMDGRTPYVRKRATSPDFTGTSLESFPRFDDRRYDRTSDDGDWVDTMVQGFSSFWS